MAGTIIKNDPEYLAWVQELSERYRRSQIKAAVSVNREMLIFYLRLGKDLSDLHAESRWGSGFFETLSGDLRKEIPDARGFSPRNLRYMKRFYELFSEDGVECGGGVILPQVAAEMFSVPWGHIRTIIDKCHGNREKAEFYIHKTVENGWSRAVLLNYLDIPDGAGDGLRPSRPRVSLDGGEGRAANRPALLPCRAPLLRGH